ncbi:U8 snoRNA-decapping enzyme [Cheilinus undulatus]|uniref:U8 snoRNA-decapping enzyme n=1 Tax=Cheilinus undulatus TaxID=241271 RepID=UPI001BD287EB|nr:U8 snoRNA-decapping enzyme [Cheilinus undulatus]XP_041654386.1 U8 snoRNA-decapping enzyme [Cheilinus undulatus]XP_041654387.1 U8 snoRNA-decapping enzyme [Cheilinus undulatus]
MASGQMSREEALACSSCRHACHAMLYCDTHSKLFGRSPIRHVILMQMRFDGLLGFPGGLVNPHKETLEAGLSRELLEELGVEVPISVEDHVETCFAPPSSPSFSSSRLILHFYVKKMDEEQIREVERAAVSTAADYGQEVLGMVRVPLYTLRSGGGLALFLSHSFIGNSRSQLLRSLLRLNMVTPEELHRALTDSLKTHTRTADDLKANLSLTEPYRKRF